MERKEISDLLVLGVIYYIPTHGYTLYEFMTKMNTEKFMDFSKATVYNTLKRMEKDGCVSSAIIETEGKPSKTIFSITKKGVEYLKELIKESILSNKFEAIFVYNISYNLHHLLEYDTLISLLEERQAIFRKTNEKTAQFMSSPENSGLDHVMIIHEINLIHTQAEIDKIDRILKLYTDKPEYIYSVKDKIKRLLESKIN